ncbi:DUF302 domain-containing protein, partial [Saprospiraceae bacterium]|nr:DUF302 domain-containing protein [Saprospiraceae bacterium]
QPYDATLSTVTNALIAAAPVNIAAQVDHTANAISAGLTLINTSVIIFGNPSVGTLLLQENQLAGLDFPQKYLIYEDDEGIVRVAFNAVEYLALRHGLENEENLTMLNGALNNFAGMTSDSSIFTGTSVVDLEEGIVIKESENNFDVTYDKLFTAIDDNPNLSIVAEVNHQEGANSVGLDLRPTKLIIFGNPNLGTPLMQSSQTVGIDLPQKMLVWMAEDSTVNVAYNDPSYLSDRHELSDVDEQIDNATTALDNLSNAAITQ